ncbi:MAG TPA: hypothetical protein VK923_12970 [Euzebyales bacterium]|nr:hypothetical protein [Euzebyales bacterium]
MGAAGATGAGGALRSRLFRRSDEQAHAMQQWEYATAPLITHALQEILNNWGDEGYELVTVVDNVAYFKRPKQ